MKTKFVSVVLTILFNLSTPFSNFSQNLSPGDIAFIGFNADDPDAFAFIALTTIPANTVIYFTDNGWKSDDTFRTGEGTLIWTSPTDEVLSETIISIELNSGWKTSLGTVSGNYDFSLSTDGDQILAYQDNLNPGFIAAINFGGTDWTPVTLNSNTSYLPSGLTNYYTAVAVGNKENAIYSGGFEGAKTELLKKINYSTRWYKNDDYRLPMTPLDFPCNVWNVISGNWNTADDWFTKSIPDNMFHVYIPAGRGSVISSSTVANCKKITLEATSSLTIESDVNGTGSLITDFAAGTGTVNVERYLPSANWHLISSPVSGQRLAAFGAAVGNNIGKYPAINPNEYDLALYLENNDTWSYVKVGGAGNFVSGTGYSVHRTVAGTVTFSGTGIYTGNQSIGITCGANTNGWNCIGNPYTSGLMSRYFLSVNRYQLDRRYLAVYRWDESVNLGGNNYGDYTTINFSTTDADTIIAPGQGFFVNSKAGGATADCTAAMQTTGGTFKSSEIPWPTIKLIAQAEGLSNVTTINFNSTMTRGLDPGFDGGKLKGNPDIALYTKLIEDNGIDFAIQALPEITTEAVRIPVGIDFVPGGEMSFMVETTAFPVDALVYFEDVQTKTTTLLNAEGAKYTVTLLAETKGAGRFNLLVTKSATGIKTVTENLFNVYNNGNTITINGPATSDTEFSLYSIDGKQLMSRRAGSMNQNTIDASAFPAGIYMLNISHQGTGIAKKLVLTK